MDRKSRNKEQIPGSKRSIYGYIHRTTPGFKDTTFKLYVLIRWDLISVSAAPQCGVVGAFRPVKYKGLHQG